MKISVDRRRVVALEVVAVVVGIILLAQTLTKANRFNGYDFSARLEQTRAFFQGIDPYTVSMEFFLTYSLFTVVFLAPFAFMPYALANVLWFLVNGFCLVVAGRRAVLAFRPELSRLEVRAVVAFGSLFLLGIVQNNFLNGQTNFLLVVLCVLSLTSLNAGRPAAAGWFWAAGIAVKVTPLVLLPYFVFRRAWSTLAWGVAATAVFVLGLPWLLGGNAVFDYYRGYVQGYLVPHIAAGTADVSLSQSFTLSRYLLEFLPQLRGPLLGFLSAGIVIAPLVWLQWRARETSQRQEALIFFAYLAAILWITPISETHHLAYLIPAVFILIAYIVREMRTNVLSKVMMLAGMCLLFVIGRWTFIAHFIAIGVCYVSLFLLALRESPGPDRFDPATARRVA